METVPTGKKYKVIQEMMSKKQYTVQLLCELAGVSRSGYYNWLKCQECPSSKQLENDKIKKLIMECHIKLKGIYGYRRVHVWLKSVHNLHMNKDNNGWRSLKELL